MQGTFLLLGFPLNTRTRFPSFPRWGLGQKDTVCTPFSCERVDWGGWGGQLLDDPSVSPCWTSEKNVSKQQQFLISINLEHCWEFRSVETCYFLFSLLFLLLCPSGILHATVEILLLSMRTVPCSYFSSSVPSSVIFQLLQTCANPFTVSAEQSLAILASCVRFCPSNYFS